MQSDRHRERKFTAIILAYPAVLIVVASVMNLLWLGIGPLVISLPSEAMMAALVLAAVLLLANHTWLMTSTELTRMRTGTFATPEEWAASGKRAEDTAPDARAEVDRRHSAHRNATENSVIFAVLAAIFAVVSPPDPAAYVWISGFALGRLGYTFAYLTGRDGLRGICMSLSLIPLYGMAGYLLIGLFQ